MEKNNFEKQVQEKMAELNIQPSEKAWAGIESRIGKKDSRRKILWFLLIGLFLLAGGGYLFLMNGKNDGKQVSHIPEIKSQAQPKNQTSIKTDSIKTYLHPGEATEAAQSSNNVQNEPWSDTNKSISLGSKRGKKSSVENNRSDTEKDLSAKNKDLLVGVPSQSNRQESQIPENPLLEKPLNEEKIKDEKNEIIAAEIKGNQEKGRIDSSVDFINSEDDLLAKHGIQDSSGQNAINKITQDQLYDKSGILKNIKSASVVSRKWKTGFSFAISKAFLGDGNHSGTEDLQYTSDLGLSFSQRLPVLNISRPATEPPVSPLNSIAFNAGISMIKDISQNISFATGLEYKYYSNTILIGDQLPSGNYFSTGYLSSYRNNFHFLELPATIQFRINENRKIPLTLSTGFTLSQLVASDAVQYKGGFYVVDNSVFNKTQFGFSAGISATFFKKISVGPYYNYGMNSLAKEGMYGKKHLNFLGIKADFIFQKNK